MPLELPDFDTLKTLAQEDPEALERMREQHVAALIDSAPQSQRSRLLGLQFQIDAQRRIHRNPMTVCIKISSMMIESFAELRSALNSVANDDTAAKSTKQQAKQVRTSAKILEFEGR